MKNIHVFTLSLLFFSCFCAEREFYRTLGVKTTATQPEIKRAFRKLSLKFHPDHNKNDPQATEKFSKINVGMSKVTQLMRSFLTQKREESTTCMAKMG